MFLTGFFDQKTAADMVKESLKMEGMEHPHVLNIIGVCMDAGPAPYTSSCLLLPMAVFLPTSRKKR